MACGFPWGAERLEGPATIADLPARPKPLGRVLTLGGGIRPNTAAHTLPDAMAT